MPSFRLSIFALFYISFLAFWKQVTTLRLWEWSDTTAIATSTLPGEASGQHAFLRGPKNHAVWSISDAGPGLNSHAEHHGSFEKDTPTLESVLWTIRNDFPETEDVPELGMPLANEQPG